MLNIDLSQRVVIDTNLMEWQGSRADGVRRKPLEQEAPESGRATSIVEFMPGAKFPEHVHGMGEEILVLEGVFSDETGDYPQGTYFRNPPGSKHSPSSKEGCKLFVKLEHFKPGDNQSIKLDTQKSIMQPGIGNLKVLSLHDYQGEHSALVWWPAGEKFQPHKHWGGEEIYVIEGEFIDEFGRYSAGTWIRNPHLSEHLPYVEEDTLILVKVGHL